MVELMVTSVAFVMGAAIPPKYAGVGADLSPPLEWNGVPEGARSIAVLCDDPDAPAGDWVHWVLFNLPPDTRKLEEGASPGGPLPAGAVEGINDFGRTGYGGPHPPPGRPHRYFFKVFALDVKLGLTSSARKPDLLKAMKGHILAEGRLAGTFRR